MNLGDARALLRAQPFSELVGARLQEFGAGRATIEVAIAERHLQQCGLVHGGVLAYLVDNALAFAAGTVLGAHVVTSGYQVSLVDNVREGVLSATAVVAHTTGREAVCTIVVSGLSAAGTVSTCAVAQGTAVRTDDT